jgi:hypothetical protein
MQITVFLLICKALATIFADPLSFRKQKELWFNEISDSITKNIHGTCQWTYESQYNSFSKGIDFFVSHKFPSLQELRSFQELPPSLIRGNKHLLQTLTGKVISGWASETWSRWMIPLDHPGQNRMLCYNLTQKLGEGKTISIFESYKAIIAKAAYTVHAKKAIIYNTGAIELECGYFQLVEGAETRFQNLKGKYLPLMKRDNMTWNQMYRNLDTYSNINQTKTYNISEERVAMRYKKVFIITAGFDNNYYHFITESLARLIRHIDFLLKNPDIKIHIRNEKEPLRLKNEQMQIEESVLITKKMKFRDELLALLGFNKSRIISGTVLAETVYLPRAASYSFSLGNPTEIRLLAKTIISSAKKQLILRKRPDPLVSLIYQIDDKTYNASRKNILILHRQKETNNHFAWGYRDWDLLVYKKIEKSFKKHFPDHYIIHHASSAALDPTYCYLCTIDELSKAEILIGMHGAGLTNQMFMPAGGIVVEMSQFFNDVHMPLCGHYNVLAPICGHHFFSYNWPWEPRKPLDAEDLGLEVAKYYQYIHSK